MNLNQTRQIWRWRPFTIASAGGHIARICEEEFSEMAGSETPEPEKEARGVRDLLAPELTNDFEYVYKRLVIYGLGKGLTLEDSKDLAGEVLLRAWEKRDRFTPRPDVPLVAWLLRLAKNLFIDRLRALEVRRRVAEEIRRDHSAECPTELQWSSLVDAEAASRRNRLVLELPEDLRPVFWAWVEQLDGRIRRGVAADQLGMTIEEFEAAKKRVGRALRRAMEALGYTLQDLLSWGSQYVRLEEG